MFGRLKDLNAAGTTVIYVTHDPGLAALAPRLITVRDGRIVADAFGAVRGVPPLEASGPSAENEHR